MIVKKVLLLLLLLVVPFSCQRGSSKKRTKQVLHLNIHTEPPTLDPRKATDSVSIFVIKQCQEGLMQRGHDGKPRPGLAKRYEVSEDGCTFTFYLRETTWSDGKPLTAHDFERSWKTLLDPSFPSDQAFELYLLKNGRAAKEGVVAIDEVGVKAITDRQLRIELEHPAPYFLSLITIHPFFPIPEPFNPNISTGPFILKKWRHFDELTLVSNPSYWDAERVKLKTVHLYIIENDQTELNLYENGQLDWAGHPFTTLPPDAVPELKKHETIHHLPLDATYLYTFNTAVYPFTNINLRRALSLAINRKAIVENIMQMGQVSSSSLVPPSMWEEKSEDPYFEESIEKAKELFALALKELGTTLEDLPPLTLSYNTSEGHHKIAQAIQQQWFRTFGLKVNLQNKEWKVFLDDLHHGNFHIARGGLSANIDDPISFLDTFCYPNSGRNTSSWGCPKYTQLIEQAEQTNDGSKRLKILQQAETLMISEMPIAPIYTYMGSFINKPYVKNVYISELGDMDIKYAYISYDEEVSP